MRVAALYDIHANLPALDAVLNDIGNEQVDCVVVGGDVVPGPWPVETIAHLRKLNLPLRFVRGNGEREVLAALRGHESARLPEPVRQVLRWVAQQLRPEDAEFLNGWPETVTLPVEGVGDVLFCHATPRDDNEIFTIETPEHRLLPAFQRIRESTVVCGHTHMQFQRIVGATKVINAGSVGMPFGEPGAYWLLIGPSAQLRRTAYDLEKTAALIRQTEFPGAAQFADQSILKPPSEAAMLAAYARAEL